MDSGLPLAPCSYACLKERLSTGIRGCGISRTNLHSGAIESIKRLTCLASKMGLVCMVGLPIKRRANDLGDLALFLCSRVYSMVCPGSLVDSQGIRHLRSVLIPVSAETIAKSNEYRVFGFTFDKER